MVRERGLGVDEAQAMIDAQWPSARKRAGATWIVENGASREALAARVGELWREIDARAAGAPDQATRVRESANRSGQVGGA
jgi:dephospho-CoA kinase